jgi:opacity protein-like surface antigen
MRKMILGAASALALASPAVAADLAVPPPYSQAPSYQRETHSYEYRTAPPVVVEQPVPPVVVERPVAPDGAGAIDITSTAVGKGTGTVKKFGVLRLPPGEGGFLLGRFLRAASVGPCVAAFKKRERKQG